MIAYLLKTLVFVLFGSFIAYSYYSWNLAHIENFDWYTSYIIIIWIIYSIYKFVQLEFSDNKASFSLLKILWYFLLHLFVLCLLFFSYNDASIWYWVVLFAKIIFYSLLPITIVLSSISFWKKILSRFKFFEEENSIYRFIISLGFWFFSYVFLIDVFWILWFYNWYIVLWILAGFIIYSYKELLELFSGLFNYKIEFDIDEWAYLKLISTEFLFIVSTLLLSVNLISIVRPFPIWWDDLWVYMNYPHLMAEAGSIISLSAMYSWQTFTGIWYIFGSPAQAFFLNNVWWFLSFIVLILISTDLLSNFNNSKTENTNKKSFLNIPMLVWTMFIIMPMIVFQQAKDMKLDSWLFFVSIIAIYLLFRYYLKIDNHSYLEKVKNYIWDKLSHKSFHINNFIVLFIIWLLCWFAFSIKFTSLLLISALIWVMFYVRMWLLWFLSYIWLYFAIFTKANLWSYMNVVVNPSKIAWFETNFSIISGIIWLALLLYSFNKNKLLIKKFLLEIAVLILWIILSLLPWIWKNVYDSYPDVTLSRILWWYADSFEVDYNKIYSKTELDNINKKLETQSISSEWTTINEDFWRYFWYEKWANNYIKLPWNLTMQVNQWGEFTDIGFLLLAFIPSILLFLPYRKKYYSLFIVLFIFLELLVFLKSDNNLIDNTKLSTYSQMSEQAKSAVFQRNDTIFNDSSFNKDIYDIKVWNYISRADIQSVVTEGHTYEEIEKKAVEAFYGELKSKITKNELTNKLSLVRNNLTDSDLELLKELSILNTSYTIFNQNINSISDLKEAIEKNKLNEYSDSLLTLWKENRTINQFMTDFLSSYNLPTWYLIVLLVFLLPWLWLLLIVDDKTVEKNKITIFNLNIVFAVFYTFLWDISAFWIVWYGIAMYFSFFLIIAIWLYFLSSYKDENDEKDFYSKLLWSLLFALIFIIYLANSVFPHSFDNLKWAWYTEYKTGEMSTIEAPFKYHQEYYKILFYLNIDQNKKEEFLKKYITADIQSAVSWIEKMDIYNVKNILTEIQKSQPVLANSAKISINNIYENISNPTKEFKNKVWIYRIGTFLKYHISENNTRLLEDSLLFSFNDYIYSDDANITIENFKKMGISYLLADLNAATIDKDERHNLTKRYERLLKTFTSDKLELIETDSACLKVALEDYSKSQKTDKDIENYMNTAGVNYEWYTQDWTTINRNTKLLWCFKRIRSLMDDWKINSNDYSYLLNLDNYIKQNKDSFKTDQQLYPFMQQQITHWYKVLFKIK